MLCQKAAATAAFCLIAVATAVPVKADPLPQPSGKPILTISGKISHTNVGSSAQFDQTMLESMGLVSVATSTPWYAGVAKFEGVRLDRLMKTVGASGTQATMIALNDYSCDIPLADFSKYEVILALKKDGDYMPVRDKGPLFVIYPFDARPELKSQMYYARSVWQLAKIVVK